MLEEGVARGSERGAHSLLPRHEDERPAARRGREAPYQGVIAACAGTA